MARPLALLLLGLAVTIPAALRPSLEAPSPRPACIPEGRGEGGARWLGCEGDRGTARRLDDAERLVLGRPVDPNTAPAHVLAHVPGLSRSVAAEIVRHRGTHGPFRSVDGLDDVRGIGPARLARARAALAISPADGR